VKSLRLKAGSPLALGTRQRPYGEVPLDTLYGL